MNEEKISADLIDEFNCTRRWENATRMLLGITAVKLGLI
jgi:hypothetical protein